jgi:hypothetical protein
MKKLGDVVKGLAGLLLLAGLVATPVTTTLGGCSPTQKEVPFETVSKHSSSDYEPREPKLVVVSKESELQSLLVLRPPHGLDLNQALSKIDFSLHFLLVAFQGYQPTGGYQIEVQNIQQLGKEIQVRAKFVRPKPAEIVRHGTTRPYHLVRVGKTDLEGKGRFTFVLVDDSSGKEVAKTVHTLR